MHIRLEVRSICKRNIGLGYIMPGCLGHVFTFHDMANIVCEVCDWILQESQLIPTNYNNNIYYEQCY